MFVDFRFCVFLRENIPGPLSTWPSLLMFGFGICFALIQKGLSEIVVDGG